MKCKFGQNAENNKHSYQEKLGITAQVSINAIISLLHCTVIGYEKIP